MATFKIKRAASVIPESHDRQSSIETMLLRDDQNDEIQLEETEEEDTWQSAIFKVGGMA